MKDYYKLVAIQEGETMPVYAFVIMYSNKRFSPLPTIYINGTKSTLQDLNKVKYHKLIGEFIYYYEEDRGTDLFYCVKTEEN